MTTFPQFVLKIFHVRDSNLDGNFYWVAAVLNNFAGRVKNIGLWWTLSRGDFCNILHWDEVTCCCSPLEKVIYHGFSSWSDVGVDHDSWSMTIQSLVGDRSLSHRLEIWLLNPDPTHNNIIYLVGCTIKSKAAQSCMHKKNIFENKYLVMQSP